MNSPMEVICFRMEIKLFHIECLVLNGMVFNAGSEAEISDVALQIWKVGVLIFWDNKTILKAFVGIHPADSRALVNPIYRSVSAGAFPPVRVGHLNRPVHAMPRRAVPLRFLGTPPAKNSHLRPNKIKGSHFPHMTADLYSVQVSDYPADRSSEGKLTLFLPVLRNLLGFIYSLKAVQPTI